MRFYDWEQEIEFLRETACFLNATRQFNGYHISTQGLSMEDM